MSYIYDNDSLSVLNQDTKIDLSKALNVHRLLSSFAPQNSSSLIFVPKTMFCYNSIYTLKNKTYCTLCNYTVAFLSPQSINITHFETFSKVYATPTPSDLKRFIIPYIEMSLQSIIYCFQLPRNDVRMLWIFCLLIHD